MRYDDGFARLYQGDVLGVLRTLPDQAANMCVTSPPYWGLRDYGTAAWDGGAEDCGHEPPQEWIDHNFNAKSGFGAGAKTQSAAAKGRWYGADGSCSGCGARRIDQQLGLEATPEEYVAGMVAVFREVRRVLRDDGTLWLNIGDSYASRTDGSDGGWDGNNKNQDGSPRVRRQANGGTGVRLTVSCKPKDLVGIPWMLALALRADGWYLRSDIIWHKPNPMPESVTDRPTKAHEYLFLLSKRATYYYDADAIKEESLQPLGTSERTGHHKSTILGHTSATSTLGANAGANSRNKRTVWTIATEPYPEAHFATFPTALVTPCVLAGCPEGGTVLEPFAGSGTTLAVAKQLGRKSIGIELNADYCGLAERRLMAITQPMFAGEVA